MANSCPPPCGDFTFPQWNGLSEVERQYYLLCAIQSGPIEPPPPSFGTTEFNGVTSAGSETIPQGWATFTLLNHASSTLDVTAAGISLPPGASIGHGTWDGFPGEAIEVIAPDGAVFTATWTIPTVTP